MQVRGIFIISHISTEVCLNIPNNHLLGFSFICLICSGEVIWKTQQCYLFSSKSSDLESDLINNSVGTLTLLLNSRLCAGINGAG